MNAKKIYLTIATIALNMATFNASASGIYPGNVLDKIHNSEANSAVNLSQARVAYSYIDAANGKLVGGADTKYVVRAGPRNEVVASTSGQVRLAFTPAESKCIQEFSLTITINNTIPFSINPSCTQLLKDGIKRTLSYTVLEISPVLLPEMTLGPFGILKLKADLNAVLKVGAKFNAGLKVDSFIGTSEPIYVNGKRAADYIYASVKPFVSGDVSLVAQAAANVTVSNVSLVSITGRATGALKLIEAEARAELKGGVAYKANGSREFQYFAGINVEAGAKGGSGTVNLNGNVKLLGMWTILSLDTNLITLKPILELNLPIFNRVVYF